MVIHEVIFLCYGVFLTTVITVPIYDNKNTINKSIELLGMNCNIVYENVMKIMNLMTEKRISIAGFL